MRPNPTENPVPAYTEARDQMIHAFALAEHIVAQNTPVVPAAVSVNSRFQLLNHHRHVSADIEVDVDVMLYGDAADAVRAYQPLLGGQVREETREGGRLFTELRGQAHGCTFKVWNLAPANAALAVA